MTIEKNDMNEMQPSSEDKEPIYFVPKRISLISDTANILSWIILVGFLGAVVAEIIGLRAQLVAQGLAIKTLLREPSLYTFIFTNMVIPLLTGLGFFGLLQAASLGLSMLLEWDYNIREGRNAQKP
jgi:hypothetical protein